MDPLKLVPPGTNSSEIFGLTLNPPNANQCMSAVVEVKVESTHVRVRCWSLLVEIGLLKWQRETPSVAAKQCLYSNKQLDSVTLSRAGHAEMMDHQKIVSRRWLSK